MGRKTKAKVAKKKNEKAKAAKAAAGEFFIDEAVLPEAGSLGGALGILFLARTDVIAVLLLAC